MFRADWTSTFLTPVGTILSRTLTSILSSTPRPSKLMMTNFLTTGISPTSLPEVGTLMIEVTPNARRIVMLKLDRNPRISKAQTQGHNAHKIEVHNISHVCHNTEAAAPTLLNLDKSMYPYCLNIMFYPLEQEDTFQRGTFYLLAFEQEIARTWSESLRETAPGGSVTLSPASSTLLSASQKWTNWPFMIQLAQHDKWKPVFLENLRAQVEEVLDIEKDTEHLEVEEKDSQWTLTSSHPQAHDDELAEVSLSSPNSRAISMTLTCSFTHPTVEEAERLSALQDLIRRKAQALDRLRVGEFEHPDEGKQALAEHLTSIGGRFWAIVIGINRYSDDEVPDLQGCLADTTLIVDYLLDTLKVPQHILVLTSPLDNKHEVGCNGLPTRAAILAALYDHFRDNDAVQMGDNLLFYFAGYGFPLR